MATTYERRFHTFRLLPRTLARAQESLGTLYDLAVNTRKRLAEHYYRGKGRGCPADCELCELYATADQAVRYVEGG